MCIHLKLTVFIPATSLPLSILPSVQQLTCCLSSATPSTTYSLKFRLSLKSSSIEWPPLNICLPLNTLLLQEHPIVPNLIIHATCCDLFKCLSHPAYSELMALAKSSWPLEDSSIYESVMWAGALDVALNVPNADHVELAIHQKWVDVIAGKPFNPCLPVQPWFTPCPSHGPKTQHATHPNHPCLPPPTHPPSPGMPPATPWCCWLTPLTRKHPLDAPLCKWLQTDSHVHKHIAESMQDQTWLHQEWHEGTAHDNKWGQWMQGTAATTGRGRVQG